MNISGGVLNPAVAIGLWALGKLKGGMTIVYIVAELVGAVLAGLLVYAAFPAVHVAAVHAGSPALGEGFSPGQGVLIEAVLTFLLMTSVLLTAVDKRAPSGIRGYGIGLTVLFEAHHPHPWAFFK